MARGPTDFVAYQLSAAEHHVFRSGTSLLVDLVVSRNRNSLL